MRVIISLVFLLLFVLVSVLSSVGASVISSSSIVTVSLSLPTGAKLLAGTQTLSAGAISAYQETGIHWAGGSGALAPLTTAPASSSAAASYLAFSANGGTPATRYLYVVQLTSTGTVLANYYHVGSGEVFSIAATSWGFVILWSDEDDTRPTLYLAAYNVDGSLKWKQTLMSNLKITSNAQAANSTQVFASTTDFGMNFMYWPFTGRVSIGSSLVMANFAHYNWFLDLSASHVGDTCLSFDLTTGTPLTIENSWGASHPLAERMIYDSSQSMFVSAALGDAYPQGILFGAYPKGSSTASNFYNSAIVDGNMPGNGGGQSLGRLGGLTAVASNLYAATYSRRVGTTGGETNAADEFGIVYFSANSGKTALSLVSKVVLGAGRTVDVVHHAVLMDSTNTASFLVIGYMTIPDPDTTAVSTSTDDFLNPFIDSSVDSMYVIVVNATSGAVVVPSFAVSACSMSANDDWVTLTNVDNRVAWAFVTGSNVLQYLYILPPTLPITTATTPAPTTATPTTAKATTAAATTAAATTAAATTVTATTTKATTAAATTKAATTAAATTKAATTKVATTAAATTKASSTVPSSSIPIYDNGLSVNWTTWNWGTVVMRPATTSYPTPYTGSSVSFNVTLGTPNYGSALYFHSYYSFSPSKYNSIMGVLYVTNVTVLSTIQVLLYGNASNVIISPSSSVLLSSLITSSTIAANTWLSFSIPFSSTTLRWYSSSSIITGVAFQPTAKAVANISVAFDAVYVSGGAASTTKSGVDDTNAASDSSSSDSFVNSPTMLGVVLGGALALLIVVGVVILVVRSRIRKRELQRSLDVAVVGMQREGVMELTAA